MTERRPLVLVEGRPTVLPAGDTLPGGAGGAQQVFVQQTRPAEPGPWVWWVKNSSGQVVNMILNDGA